MLGESETRFFQVSVAVEIKTAESFYADCQMSWATGDVIQQRPHA